MELIKAQEEALDKNGFDRMYKIIAGVGEVIYIHAEEIKENNNSIRVETSFIYAYFW